MKRVLIITSGSELYYLQAFLEACSKERNLDVVLLDTEKFPSEITISVKMARNGTVTGHLDVFRRANNGNLLEDKVSIESIELAWHLRARDPVPRKVKDAVELKFALDESTYALRALQVVAPWRWINKRSVIRAVENNKLYQQKIAASSGLQIPETLATNNPGWALDFSSRNENILVKLFGYPAALAEGNFCYSNLFSSEEIAASAESIHECPVFAQEYVQKKYEYRVTMVGEEILACRIDSQASIKTLVDWRHYDFDNVKHEGVILPTEVNTALLRFMKNIDLQYGAVDLIETPEGEFVFLEVNPSGQWGWIHHYANLPIPDAVARLLAQS